MVLIYVLLDPVTGTPRYVGCTTRSLKSRLNGMKWCVAAGSDKPLHNWIRSLPTLPRMVLLQEARSSKTERRWIRRFKNAGFDLLNIANGGFGSSGCETPEEQKRRGEAIKAGMTDEAREKIRRSQIGRVHTAEENRRMSISVKAAMTPEVGAKISAATTGKPKRRTAEHNAKIAAALIGNQNGRKKPIGAPSSC